nr:transposase, MuDR, MULE transposase domain protein [Tanacetum cinerariifolium]
YRADYDDEDQPIPFRRRVFPSSLDGILQLVLLGVNDRRAVPNWILRLENDRDGWDDYPLGSYVWPTLYYQLRDANVKRWLPLYAIEPTNEVIRKRIRFLDSLGLSRHYPRVVAWSSNKKFYRHMLHDFLHGRVPAERLIPDEIEGVPSSYQTPTSNSFFNMGTPINWQTLMPSQPGSSNWQSQMPAYTPTPNWQPPIPSYPGDASLCGGDDVVITGVHDTGIYFTYENVDPNKQMNAWIEILIRSMLLFRHLMKNLSLKRNKTKGLFWIICKAYILEEFSNEMSNLQAIQPDAYHKLIEVDPQRWSRAHCLLVRYNYMTSHSMESVNAYTVLYRKLPVLKLDETYRAMVQEWYFKSRELADNMTSEITE